MKPPNTQALPIQDRRTTDSGLGGRVVSIETRLDRGDARMGRIETSLAENTKATQEVLEIIRMGRSFFKVCGNIGNVIKWIASIAAGLGAAYAAWKHGA